MILILQYVFLILHNLEPFLHLLVHLLGDLLFGLLLLIKSCSLLESIECFQLLSELDLGYDLSQPQFSLGVLVVLLDLQSSPLLRLKLGIDQ